MRKASELALLQLNAELEAKVEARTQSLREALEREKDLSELKSRFVSMASHEFRTPLSTILSSAYLVSQYPGADDHPRREKHVQRIVSSVNVLTDILNDFLSVGRIEEGKIHVRPAQVVITEWMKAMVSELETILKKGQQLQYVHEGDAEVLLDQSLLRHIVQNLVSNAVKFSPDDSVIYLSTQRKDNELILTVRDSGIGIPPEDQKHLFERFFRAALTNTWMKTILLIEDNPDIRENMGEILELANYKVLLAPDGKQGVSMALAQKPDIIVCDIMMPELDGYGVIHLLQKHEDMKRVPFIFITAKTERAEIRKGMELGADDYITKPFTGTELLNAIEGRLKKAAVEKSGQHAEQRDTEKEQDILAVFREKQDVSNYRKKQLIYSEGQHAFRLFYVEQGKVKIFKTNDDGKDLITRVCQEGEFFGYTALLEVSHAKPSNN
ncbi:response regulator receiver domain protein [Ostertagia ostertagi]